MDREKEERLDQALNEIVTLFEKTGKADPEVLEVFSSELKTIPGSENVLLKFWETFGEKSDDEFGDESHESATSRTELHLFIEFFKMFKIEVRYVNRDRYVEKPMTGIQNTEQQVTNQINASIQRAQGSNQSSPKNEEGNDKK